MPVSALCGKIIENSMPKLDGKNNHHYAVRL